MDLNDIILGSAIGAGLITLFIEAAKVLFQYYVDSKKTENLTKRELGKEVLQILSEGKHSDYRIEPKDEGKVTFITEQVNLHDEDMARSLDVLISAWKLCSTLPENKGLIKELQNFCLDVHKILVRKLKKWK